MDYAYEERIGNPDLFTGRKEELLYFLKWISDVKERKSMSTAILARRKMGKTALPLCWSGYSISPFSKTMG